MRIHSDKLTPQDVHKACRARGMSGVYAEVAAKGSRKRDHAFEISMTGNSPYRTNSGNRGAAYDDRAAQWDEWGIVIAELFALDPEAIIGQYKDADTFHQYTVGRFHQLQGHETHRRHKWDWDGGVGLLACKCGAELDNTAR